MLGRARRADEQSPPATCTIVPSLAEALFKYELAKDDRQKGQCWHDDM